MKKLMVKGLVMAGLMFMISCNETSTTDDTTEVAKDSNETKMPDALEDDGKFAVAAADGGMMEVQLGQLALTNASSASVKKHAQMMIDDHGKANSELKALAASKNITLPTAMSEDRQKTYDDLKAKTGADFDKAYTDLMLSDHKEDIDQFNKEANNGTDAEIKAWAAGKVPKLEQHLQGWRSTKDAMK